MSIRITMGMISKQYNKSLNQSLSDLNYYSTRTTSLRKYDKASEDPVSAVKAYKARRALSENENYQSTLEDAQSMMTTAESSVMQVNSIAQQANSTSVIQAITDTVSADDREVIAKQIRSLQDSLVSIMNTKYSDNYIFGGSATAEAPFSVDADGNLLYRNVDVNTGEYAGFDGTAATLNISGAKINFGQANGDAFDDYMIKIVDGTDPYVLDTDAKTLTVSLDLSGGATNQDLQDELRSAFTAAAITGTDASLITVGDLTASITVQGTGVVSGGEDPIAAGTIIDLDSLAKEQVFIDIGLGMSVDSSGNVDEQSVFDISLPGISFLGYGTNSDGVPKNMYSLLGDIADKLESDSYSFDEVQPYLDQFDVQYQNLLVGVTQFGTKSNYLDSTKTRLSDMNSNLTERIDSIEYVDSAEAILDYQMQKYTYQAALQMGTQILQPTFLDFMN